MSPAVRARTLTGVAAGDVHDALLEDWRVPTGPPAEQVVTMPQLHALACGRADELDGDGRLPPAACDEQSARVTADDTFAIIGRPMVAVDASSDVSAPGDCRDEHGDAEPVEDVRV